MPAILIAVVDDDPEFLSLITELLRASGYAALGLANDHSAVERLCAARPNLILLDVNLGGNLNGWEILEYLRYHPETSGVPVIMLSADVSALLGENQMLPALGVDVLQKPFRWDTLKTKIERGLTICGIRPLHLDQPATSPTSRTLPTSYILNQ